MNHAAIIDAEKSLLGGLFLDPEGADDIAALVTPADFLHQGHAKVYEAMLALQGRAEPVTRAAVKVQLTTAGLFAAVGGDDFVDLLDATVPAGASLYYARKVAEAALRRRAAAACSETLQELQSGEGETRAVVEQHEARMFALSHAASADDLEAAGAVSTRCMAAAEARYAAGRDILGMETGLRDLDRLTGGLLDGDLVLIGARPSMGKTALAEGIAQHRALDCGEGVAFFSLEMPKQQVIDRTICARARIDSKSWQRGRLTDAEWRRVAAVNAELAAASFYIDDTSGLSLPALRAKCRRLVGRLKQQGKALRLVVVDYVQLMDTQQQAGQSRDDALGGVSRGLKSLAKQLGCPLIALAQLNRAVEHRENKRPTMADLRECGSLEADADKIALLYRDEVYNPQSSDAGTAEVIIGKNRQGAPGVVRVAWIGQHFKFADLSRDHESEAA